MIPRLLAIIPAAGRSRRMGQPKLLLDIAGQSVISRVLSALQEAGIARTLVVVRSDDEALIHEARQAGGAVVTPAVAPEEMRQSVEIALQHVRHSKAASETYTGWMLVPADHPTLHPEVIQRLIAAWRDHPQRIAVPVHAGRRGHPTLFPWSMVDEVFSLPSEQGLNRLLRMNPESVLEVEVADSRVLDDLDTPEDLIRLQQDFQRESPDRTA